MVLFLFLNFKALNFTHDIFFLFQLILYSNIYYCVTRLEAMYKNL